MPIPAILWSLAAGHGIWYPVNLLAAMAMHYDGPADGSRELEQFHADWFVAALGDSRGPVARFRLGVRARAAAAAGDSRAAGLGRTVAAAALDRDELRPDGRRESGAARARRLALVRRLAVRVRHRGGDRRRPFRRSLHSPRRERPRSTPRSSSQIRRQDERDHALPSTSQAGFAFPPLCGFSGNRIHAAGVAAGCDPPGKPNPANRP